MIPHAGAVARSRNLGQALFGSPVFEFWFLEQPSVLHWAKQYRAEPVRSWGSHIQGWMNVRESCSRALGQGTLSTLPLLRRLTQTDSSSPFFWSLPLRWSAVCSNGTPAFAPLCLRSANESETQFSARAAPVVQGWGVTDLLLRSSSVTRDFGTVTGTKLLLEPNL